MTEKMKIAINGMALAQNNGTGRYSREIIRWLLILNSTRDRRYHIDVFIPEDVPIPMGPWEDHTVIFGNYGAYWHYSEAPRTAAKMGYDLYHDLCHFTPKKIGIKTVVTIHDLAPLENSRWASMATVMKFRTLMGPTLKNADVIITPSEFTASRIRDLFDYEGRIEVVHHGGDHIEYTAEKGEYAIHVGPLNERKGGHYVKSLKERFPVEVFSTGDWAYVDELREKLRDDDALRKAYSRAVAYISFSQYEGFGLPVVEAGRNGTPALLNPLPAYKEILGDDYGGFIEFNSVEDMLSRLNELRDDDKLWSRMSEDIKKRTSQYRWEISAEKTLSIYDDILSL